VMVHIFMQKLFQLVVLFGNLFAESRHTLLTGPDITYRTNAVLFYIILRGFPKIGNYYPAWFSENR
jgi:hypothetical protein